MGSNSSLYSDTKNWNLFEQKNVKITKKSHAFKNYASFYEVEILNSFNSELQLKDNESAIKQKLKKLLTKLRGFKFVTKLILMIKKKKLKIKKKMTHFFIHTQKQKQLLMKVILTMCLNKSILKLYQIYKLF